MFATSRRAVYGQARRGLSQAQNPAVSRLLSTLAILEQREGKLNIGSLSAVTAAKALGGPIHAFIAGANAKSVAEEAAKVDGVEKIIIVDSAAYDKVCNCAVGPWHHDTDQSLPC
jgi:electron transfer flavoprotein alpha subunit